MKISLNEIKKLVEIPAQVSTDELVELIGARLVEVEEKIDLSQKYQGIKIAKVIECEAIPDTHLHLCQISLDDQSSTQPIQVVCGAPNVHKGMLAVWLPPGTIVPQTYGNEDFKLEVLKLKGYESHGMLAGLDELDLGDDHSGIVEIDPKFASAGDDFAKKFELNDIILDIENKSLTHRPDTFGLIGFAREVAGILGVKFTTPDFIIHPQAINSDKKIHINIQDPKLCPRYTCAVLELPDAIAQTKYLTPDAVFLAKAGMRSISKIVDLTNIIMLKTGQPLHAFDYDKFIQVGGSNTPKILVRAAKPAEELQLLDGKTIQCEENDILITSNDIPVALAGAMGGASTAIDSSTQRIILESASFSLYNLRRTQMKHGIFSEAITRFTKGQPPHQAWPVLLEAIKMSGGELIALADDFPGETFPAAIEITPIEINQLLGTNYDLATITTTLTNVGLIIEQSTSSDQKKLEITPPFWRTDLHIKEDIIEEVGRLLGFDNIPLDFPTRPFIGAAKNPLFQLKNQLRDCLSGKLASHEVLTYSFTHQKLLEITGEDPKDSYKITNSISPDLQYFRPSIIPSLLEKMHDNLKAGYVDFSLFELNQTAKISAGLSSEKVPNLTENLSFLVTGDYYLAKAYLENLMASLRLSPTFTAAPVAPYFEPLHAAVIKIHDQPVGSVGEIKPSILQKLKINQAVAGFELNLEKLLNLTQGHFTLKTLSKFPPVERDITFKVKKDQVTYQAVLDGVTESLLSQELLADIKPVSLYQAEPTTINISFHLSFSHPEKTLDGAEISAIIETVTKKIKTDLGAEVV